MKEDARRRMKNEIYGQFARVTRALSSPKRLELVDLLAQAERSVEELADEADMSIANTSRHLQVLRGARIVEIRREGTYAHYRLADEQVSTLWRAVRSLGEARLAEIDRVVESFRERRDPDEAVDIRDLKTRLRQTVILDVRPRKEYRAGHIPGARSIPIEELGRRWRELPKHRTIVAYCRGPYCVFADEAVAFLQSRGFRAHRLREGFPEWRGRGLAVEQGDARRGERG